MMTESAKAIAEGHLKRPWYRLHLSTWMVILLLMSLFVIVEVPGEVPGAIGIGGGITSYRMHGWPWSFLIEYDGSFWAYTDADVEKAPWLVLSAWDFSYSSPSSTFSVLHLILDLVTVVAIICVIAALVEYRRRRIHLFAFTLRELLILTLLTAVVMSWWRIHHNRRVHEREVAGHFQGNILFD